jgi:uncharacterized tellurite resistance protein B-like protein
MQDNFQKSLIYLTYSVIRSDGEVHFSETNALNKLLFHEGISLSDHERFLDEINPLTPQEIFNIGLRTIKECAEEERKKILAWIYTLVEAYDTVDVREARFLLYAINATNLDLEEIIRESEALPELI